MILNNNLKKSSLGSHLSFSSIQFDEGPPSVKKPFHVTQAIGNRLHQASLEYVRVATTEDQILQNKKLLKKQPLRKTVAIGERLHLAATESVRIGDEHYKGWI